MKTIGSAENILFWSKEQLRLLDQKYEEYNRVMFHSAYGSGKSIIMREKCEQLARKGFECLYVIGGTRPSKKYTLLHLKHKKMWQGDDDTEGNILLRSLNDLMVRNCSLLICNAL